MGVSGLSSYGSPVSFIEGVVLACIPKRGTTFLDASIVVLIVLEHVERGPDFLHRASDALRLSSVPVARTDNAVG